jgi:putative nucleotidyltransferase with HDIG domain
MDIDTKIKKKRVYIENASPNMALADDIIDENGEVLLPRDTTLSRQSYQKLRELGIREIYVKSSEQWEEGESFESIIENSPETTISESITERDDFKNFQKKYEETSREVNQALREIAGESPANLEKLYGLVLEVIKEVKSKSDIFNYLVFIDSENDKEYAHSMNVALLCNIFSAWLNLDPIETRDLTIAGLLHDIGKLEVDPAILNKNGRLTDEEFREMKNHSLYGYRILEKQKVPKAVKLSALMHHEKIDGNGYPLGLTGEQISEYAKIVSICDIYDAMTTDRAYRKKILPFDVIRTFETSSFGELDTKYLLIFLKNIAYNYLGAKVILSDGSSGEIVFINQNALSRPMVKTRDAVIDLNVRKELFVESFI